MEARTPMMSQWDECKQKAKEALLLFRLGDFYEAFEKDAEIIAKELSLTLTQRQSTPMCGIPFHAAEGYIDKLIAKGHKVAIAEQMEDPSQVKGIVRRDVVRIITPGTLLNSQLLSDKKNNFFASLVQVGSSFGLSYLDLSTAEFISLELDHLQEVINALYRIRPAEILTSEKFQTGHPQLFQEISHTFPFLLNLRPTLDLKLAIEVLCCQFQVTHLDSLHLRGKNAAICAAGSLLLYLKEELDIDCDHIVSIEPESMAEYMGLDRASLRNLELIESMDQESSKHTLFGILDRTLTPMGGRQLAKWIQTPLLNCEQINKRQESIQQLITHEKQAAKIRDALNQVRDLERLAMKMSTGYATPRDLLALGVSLQQLPPIARSLSSFNAHFNLDLVSQLTPFAEKIVQALNEQLPIRPGEGDLFKPGYHTELDSLRKLAKDSTSYLAQYQQTLRDQTNIKNLKVSYTRAFGYFIEVTQTHSHKVPDSFQRKQTLVNAERFVTEELKEYERKALTADLKAKSLESELFDQLKQEAASFSSSICRVAKEIATLDCLLALAKVAQEKNWIRPTVDLSNELIIEEGRHPIVENVVGQADFIANDTHLSPTKQMMLITGPNMAGKSTYIRQVALLVILAQIGSYLPAKQAKIGLVDQVFSRIGASDDLARGQSTFMVEMTETANILKHATTRSLVLLDEIGRGTSTYDGISIAWAVAEYLLTAARKQAKTLFATHYWELTQLSDSFPQAMNFRIAVEETSSGIVFLRKIIQGATDKSYGIHVAKLAGLPNAAIKKAEEMLKKLEMGQSKRKKIQDEQLPLFSPSESIEDPLKEEMRSLDVNRLTPLEAIQKLAQWQKTYL